MDSSTKPQTTATPPPPIISQTNAHLSSETCTRPSSPIQNVNRISRSLPRSNHGSTFWTEPLYIEYSPSVTPYSSPPYTRQGSVVDLEALKKEQYMTINSKPSHTPKEPYHVFSHGKKWSIVILIGVAGLFSGLSSNIYFPALDAISKVSLAKSDQCIRDLCIVLTLFEEFPCQLTSSVPYHHVVSYLPSHLSYHMGLSCRLPRASSYIHGILWCLYRCQCGSVFCSQLCGASDLPRPASCWKCVHSEHW